MLLRAATRDFNARARARRIVMPCAPHCSTLHDYVTTSMGSGGSFVRRALRTRVKIRKIKEIK